MRSRHTTKNLFKRSLWIILGVLLAILGYGLLQLNQYRLKLKRDLSLALALSSTQADGIRLQNRYRDLREHHISVSS
ncbi:MAG: hypothetical protein HC930_13915 [Hydrococcus sp. SU_1_0]|nr:hypothetical protein [Hydrococcus sp. SU_1_0]